MTTRQIKVQKVLLAVKGRCEECDLTNHPTGIEEERSELHERKPFRGRERLMGLRQRTDATCPEQLTVMSLPMRPFLDLGVRHPVKYVYRSKSFSS